MKQNEDSDKKPINRLLPLLFLFSIILLIYSNAFNGDFHLDDWSYIKYENDQVKNFDAFKSIYYWINVNGRPLPTFTFAINYFLNDLNPTGYHIVNKILHIIVAIVSFFLMKQILLLVYGFNKKEQKKIIVLSFIIALLYSIHPVQTQTVNYIVQRMTMMAALFSLLSVLFYIIGRKEIVKNKNKNGYYYYILSAVSFLLGVLSKQNVVILPFIFLLVELFFIRDEKDRVKKKFIWLYTSSLIALILVVVLGGFLPKGDAEINRITYFTTQLKVILGYWGTVLFPYSLNFDHHIEVYTGSFTWLYIVSTLIHLMILVSSVLIYSKNKLISFGIIWFYLTLAVESSIIPIRDLRFDHRLYLPLLGFIIILIESLFVIWKKNRSLAYIILSSIVFLYSVKTYTRNKVWDTELSFWTDVTSHHPVKARAYRFLGIEYMKMGKYNEALVSFDKALTLEPRWQEYHNKYSVYILLRNTEAALNELNKSITLDSTQVKLYVERANLYLKSQDYKKCKNDLDIAYALNAENSAFYNTLGKYYLAQSNNIKAFDTYTLAIKTDCFDMDTFVGRGVSLMRQSKFNLAIQDFTEAIKIDKSNVIAYLNRADSKFQLNQFNSAIKDYTSIILLDAKNKIAFKNRGFAYFKQKKYKKAYSDLIKAKSLGAEIHPNLLNDIKQKIQ